MAEESFLMFSLKDEKSKKLAQVISNNTSRKILNELSKKSMTETELSKFLSLPISTVHYNLKALEEAKLIQADEFHYSEKGKEVNHYTVTNKLVIIAPKSEDNIWSKLKSMLVALGISVVATGALFFSRIQPQIAEPSLMVAKAVPEAFAMNDRIAGGAEVGGAEVAEVVASSGPDILSIIFSTEHGYIWFLAGVLFFAVSYMIISVLWKNTSIK